MRRRILPGPLLLALAIAGLVTAIGGVGFAVLRGGAEDVRAAVAAQERAVAALDAGSTGAAAPRTGTAGQVRGTSAATGTGAPSNCSARARALVTALDAAGRQATLGLAPELDEAILARAALDSGRPRCPREQTHAAVTALATYVDAAAAPEADRTAAWARAADQVDDARRQLATAG